MDIKTTFESYLTWFKAHERLVLLIALGFFSVHLYHRYLDYQIKHDQTQAQIANTQAQAAATKVGTDDTANKLLLAQLQTLQQQVALTNTRIDQQMRDRGTATIQQKQKDDQASSSELAARIAVLLGTGHIEVEPQAANVPDKLAYSLDAAHADADKLEDLQKTNADNNDLRTELVSCKSVTDKQADTITGLNTQIADGKTALGKEHTAHVEDVKTLNSEKKRARLNGFKWGAITGFLGSLFVHKP
jgi:hypothetical protein